MTTNKTERDYSHRSLVDKLGIKPEHRVYARGISEPFLRGIAKVLNQPVSLRLSGTFDLLFVHIDAPGDLAAVEKLALHLKPAGGLWLFHPKGKGASPSDSEVRAAGLAAGLVDNKICAYSDTHTATRYVIPRAKR